MPTSHLLEVLTAILIPGLIALAIYLSAIYIFYPLYLSRQRYAQYLPLSLGSSSSPPSNNSTSLSQSNSLLGRAVSSINGFLGGFTFLAKLRDEFFDRLLPERLRGGRRASYDDFIGDEELDDGPGLHAAGNNGGTGRDGGMGNERRLSRELEAGFRDDSDEEEEIGARGARGAAAGGRR